METNLYRKYRPNNFADVVGQQVIVRTLINSINNQSIAHAYLFSGVRGTGKTSIAKIFARAINCQDTENPLCGKCEMCEEFGAQTEIPDIFEIDAASNNGVDEIRKIIENVKYMPIRMKYKVYIIDEVHMLTKGAFNALLKTLEEPPAHIIFILATTEPNKIPVTILSRVQRFEFTRIDEELMLNHLQKVLDLEGTSYEDEALKLIVTHADGGLRDALSLLTKVVSYAPSVTIDSVTESLNLTAKTISEELLIAITKQDPEKVSESYKSLIAGGADEIYLVQDLIEAAKVKLVEKISTDQEGARIYTKVITKLMEALANIKSISNSSLYIEVILIELALKPKEQVIYKEIETAKRSKPQVSEEEKLNTLKEQAAKLSNLQEESEPENIQPNKEELDSVNVPPLTDDQQALEQLDALFGNVQASAKPINSEDKAEEIVSQQEYNPSDEAVEVTEETIIDQPIDIIETEEIKTEEVEAEENIALDPKLENITIIDTLKHATKNDKQAAMIAASKAADNLNMSKQYGIAKFFEMSVIQGASSNGIVISIEQNLYATYESRLDQIQSIYSNVMGSSMKIHLLTTQYWKQERMNFVRAVKENKEVDIFEEAETFFGKEIVNKVNS